MKFEKEEKFFIAKMVGKLIASFISLFFIIVLYVKGSSLTNIIVFTIIAFLFIYVLSTFAAFFFIPDEKDEEINFDNSSNKENSEENGERKGENIDVEG